MNPFSALGAWSHGVRFLSARPVQQAALLVGLGLLVPWALLLVLRYAVFGSLLGPAVQRVEPGPLYLLAPALGMVCQTSAFFASWRLGIDGRERLGGALRYGLVAGFVAALAAVLLMALAGFAASQSGSPAFALFVFLFTLAPVILLLAYFGTVAAALIGAGVAAAMALSMVISAWTGDIGFAATLVGGSGLVVVLLLLLSVLMIWLAARFSCATAIMADARSYNLIAAGRASWELTWDEQWRVMRYLALLGGGLLVMFLLSLMALGGGISRLQFSSPEASAGVAVAYMLGISLPMVFVAAMVPAGIYRQLKGERPPVEVFA